MFGWRLGAILATFLLLTLPAPAFATCDTDSPQTCAVVGAYSAASITPPFGGSPGCQRVTNNNSVAIVVPMINQTAWASFVANPHPNVSLGGCTTYYWGGWGGCSTSCGWGTQYRSCYGTDGGTYDPAYCGGGATSQSCYPGGCACAGTPWGTLSDGQQVTGYAADVVACGGSCSSQVRTCSNGTLDGSYNATGCSVGSCSQPDCPASGICPQTASGGSCTTYTVSKPAVADCCCATPCLDYRVRLTCNSGTWNGTPGAYASCTCSASQCCLSGKTTILMADGSKKLISDLKAGDAVQGKDRVNHVLRVPSRKTKDTLYSFNNGEPFTTGGHPFWTQDGWKSVDPSLTAKEDHRVETAKLNLGDTLYLENGETILLETITPYPDLGESDVFNPVLDGDNTYYGNGYLVHNKYNCS